MVTTCPQGCEEDLITNLFAVQQTVLKLTGNEPTNMIIGIMAKGRFAKMLKYQFKGFLQ